uniref:Female-specific orf protein n=1 Tax=Venustaconcha ellipsiformis TaxID=301928 RepID=F4ZFV5_VENEL|nr:female-specific orf protein [Venustaconcha ellipsiformis]
MVMKMKTQIMNLLNNKMVQKLIIIFTTGLFLMIILPSPFLLVSTKITYPELSLTDNPPEKNQPTSTSTASTGSYPIKNSPASTNISDKT